MVNADEWSFYFYHNTVSVNVTFDYTSERGNLLMVMMHISVYCVVYFVTQMVIKKIPTPGTLVTECGGVFYCPSAIFKTVMFDIALIQRV
jgi:uncharacterized membrane protein YjgN (DUF898 family)